jgi:hypothetical protein
VDFRSTVAHPAVPDELLGATASTAAALTPATGLNYPGEVDLADSHRDAIGECRPGHSFFRVLLMSDVGAEEAETLPAALLAITTASNVPPASSTTTS